VTRKKSLAGDFFALNVRAGDLAKATVAALPKRSKKVRLTPVSLEFDGLKLSVIEAKHGLFENALPDQGMWPDQVQVDGGILARVVSAHPESEMLELIAEAESLVVRRGKAQARITRLDGASKKAIKRTTPLPDRRHTGKLERADAPLQPSVPQKEIWLFSARIPLPEHRNPKED
jgi:hypothetical protein